ncbi:hypothetical protein AFK68_17010 [Hydrocoleum sp. CS-953]|nr:hypothetical protein AFK68_17010 [Hydrocoleum sp. CS-953]
MAFRLLADMFAEHSLYEKAERFCKSGEPALFRATPLTPYPIDQEEEKQFLLGNPLLDRTHLRSIEKERGKIRK